MSNSFNKANVILIVFIAFIGIGFGVVWSSMLKHKKQTQATQGYVINMVCVANEISPEGRPRRPNYREYCYQKAEELSGAKIHHFGLEDR